MTVSWRRTSEIIEDSAAEAYGVARRYKHNPVERIGYDEDGQVAGGGIKIELTGYGCRYLAVRIHALDYGIGQGADCRHCLVGHGFGGTKEHYLAAVGLKLIGHCREVVEGVGRRLGAVEDAENIVAAACLRQG